MQKARSHPRPLSEDKDQAPTACMHTVSGSLSLAVRRAFHLSLTVLFTIGHGLVFSLGGWSPQIQPGFLVSRPTRELQQILTRISHTGLSPSPVRRSRRVPLCFPDPCAEAPQPRAGLTPHGLGSSLFARRYSGNLSFDFSSSGYLDVSVPRVGLPRGMAGHHPRRVSPFGHLRI